MSDAAPPFGFVFQPAIRGLGSAMRGQQMLDGRLNLTGGYIEGDPFGTAPVPANIAEEFHGFGWLDDLVAVNSAKSRDLAQRRVLDWIAAYPKPPGESFDPQWRADVTGRRVLRWILHSGQILPGLDRNGAQPFFDSLHAQLALLEGADAESGRSRIEALSGRAIAAMSLRGAETRVPPALEALAREVENSLHRDVMHSRDAEALLTCLSLLGWVRETAIATGHTLPRQIDAAIEEIVPVLRALRHADGGLPRCHGSGRGVSGRLDHSLRMASGPADPARGHAIGYARLARARATVILDASAPPAGAAAAHAHASTLAIEFTSARHPIIVNCGSGRHFGGAWPRASRATACHSTLCLSGLSSAKLLPPDGKGNERLTLLPQKVWAGKCDRDGNLLPPDQPLASPHEAETILSGHDAWQGTHGLTHLRELYLSPDGDELRGEDTLAALDEDAEDRLSRALQESGGIRFEIRFHLHPAITAIPDGDAVRLELPGNEEWYFSHDLVAGLTLEPSAYLEAGEPEPLASSQIVLRQTLQTYAMQISWTLMRAGAS
ncbi:heparinase II/III family protein [Paracoccus aerodenitrificans]|uniref:heparinase II/III family protein n=1 Tax=Paracoccus aerodenitrificans TaxID=3017781 RepID=UPI0022F00E97|nr:heparinase II/III family protein [Paracoccus aerodenitrificans]WBU64089.1 heparinase II/III family protein [Paracoccus aerodenitrificans]